MTRVVGLLLLPFLISNYSGCKRSIMGYIRWIFLFYVFCTFSILWTPDVEEGYKELIYYIIHFVVFFEILVFSKKANNPLTSLSRGWLIAVALTLIVAVWELVTDQHLSLARDESGLMMNVGNGVQIHRRFASVTFINQNAYVTFLCVSFSFVLYYLSTSIRQRDTLMSIISITLSIICLIMNASRGGILALVIIGTFFYLFTSRNRKWNIYILLIGIILIVVLYNYGSIVLSILEYRSSDGAMFEDDARMAIWSNALKAFGETYGFGVGIGGMQNAMAEVSAGIAVTHNMALEILLQYGVFFFVVFIVFYVKLLIRSIRLKEKYIKATLISTLSAMPIYTIITSQYLISPLIFVAFSSLIVFAYYESFRPVCKDIRISLR